jgi:hypothetical protein
MFNGYTPSHRQAAFNAVHEKVNVTGLEQVMKMQARLCEVSARNLSILDIGP